MLFRQYLLWSLTLIAGLAISACNDDAANSSTGMPAGQGIPAKVGQPDTRIITEWDEFTGRFRAQDRIEIRARVSGYLNDVQFEDGQIVEKGDTLFIIDQRPFQNALDGAQARFDAANNEYKRSKTLRKSKAISEENYDERLQAMRVAKSELSEAKLNFEFTQVKAPITGRISKNNIDIGNLVQGDTTILTTLVSIAPIEFYFEASETDLLKYLRTNKKEETHSNRGKGLPVFLKLQDENDYIHEGKINFSDNELNEGTGTIQVRAIFENQEQLFEPGMFARIRIARDKPSEKIIIPQHIIGTEMTRKYVYALDDDNKAARTYITLGSITKDGMQVVYDGLDTSDRIIMGGLHMVQPGALIMPIPSPTDAPEERTEIPVEETSHTSSTAPIVTEDVPKITAIDIIDAPDAQSPQILSEQELLQKTQSEPPQEISP